MSSSECVTLYRKLLDLFVFGSHVHYNPQSLTRPFSPHLQFSVCRNAEKILGYLSTGVLSKELIPPHINYSHLSAQDYAEMYTVIKTVKEDTFDQLGLDACVLEDELNKVSGPQLKR